MTTYRGRKKGYFGIGVYHPKTKENIGTLWRSADNFGADYIFTIGRRYKRQASDTTGAESHIPLYEFDSIEDFKKHLPRGCRPVFTEQTDDAVSLTNFTHPKQCAYILGAEDNGIPENLMRGEVKVEIDTPQCLNVSVAGSIVMYDRQNKKTKP